MNKKIAEFAFRSFLHGNKIGYPPPNATFPPKKLPALWCIMKPNHPLKGPNCSATRWVLTPAAFLQPLRVNLEQVPLIVPAVLLCMGLGCGDPMVYDEDPTRWVGDDLKIFEDRYLSYILLFDIYMDLHFKTCFMIIMFIVFFFCIFSVQMIWWISKQHFLRSWFGITQLFTLPFGKNRLPRENSQQESVFESKPQQSKVQQTTSLTMVSHL